MAPLQLEEYRFGTRLDSLLNRRERSAKKEGVNFGAGCLFKDLASTVLSEIKPGSRVLEVDAGVGLLTRLLLACECKVTALEPTPLLFERLGEIDHENLTVICGFTEDLPTRDNANEHAFDYALVSFASRRGRGLLALVNELLPLVASKILLILPDDGSLDWSYVTRASALEGLSVTARFLVDSSALEAAVMQNASFEPTQIKRAILLTILTDTSIQTHLLDPAGIWESAARTITMPYPAPRGAATRLIRYFKGGGERAVLIKTEACGIDRLYGNLRTAAHRIARNEITVRRVDTGVQLMLIPRVKGEYEGGYEH